MLSAEKEAASRFLGRVLRKGDLAMVMSFDIDVDLLADFTDDRGRLDRAINRAQINAPGSSAIIAQGPLQPVAAAARISTTPSISPPTISSPVKPAEKRSWF